MGKNTQRKSSKALQASSGRSIPWMLIAGILVVLVFAGGIFGYAYTQFAAKQERQEALAPFVPSPENRDPSKKIPGVMIENVKSGIHVKAPREVAYNEHPPVGGPHDRFWATCTGVVYEQPIRTENAVHSLEHGAVWITYQPDKLSEKAVQKLAERVKGKPYMLMSPFPTMDSPISLQSWGHQLKVKSADDPRIDQFIRALRVNEYTHPEVGASCQSIPGGFDPQNPPPFKPGAGPNAMPMDGGAKANNKANNKDNSGKDE